ncbi:MAG: L,D-transpeptidase, partial [Gemmatimonadaceae bacterium]
MVKSALVLGVGFLLTLSVPGSAQNPNASLPVQLRVSVPDRMLWAFRGSDTLMVAPIGVATGATLAFAGKSWRFRTPQGVRRVLGKQTDPVWTPPDWHYAEAAREHGLRLVQLTRAGARLRRGLRLVVRDDVVSVLYPDGIIGQLPVDEHIVFDGVLFIPPYGTKNRVVTKELGEFALDLGGGYLIHGTPDEESVGQLSTHGCIRMRAEDLAWLYEHVSVGT